MTNANHADLASPNVSAKPSPIDTTKGSGSPSPASQNVARTVSQTARQPDDGKAVLIYDNLKANREHRRLPIGAATAAVIEAQQQRSPRSIPDRTRRHAQVAPRNDKKPPRPQADHRALGVGSPPRAWISALPEVHVATSVEIHGKPAATMLPFDKMRIFPYAYRHTYAQRHADAGVAVDTLRELMDHRLLDTTQSYYNVGETRRREAVERVTAMQFDRHGNRVWRTAKALLDSEHARRAVGEVAVPYGACSEPSNVAAGGHDCPIRFRCVGCGHFSTDVSYLPDLETYLADLLRNRERLLAAVDADEWAETEAMPSDEEITRVRRLISRSRPTSTTSPTRNAQRSRNPSPSSARPATGRRARAAPHPPTPSRRPTGEDHPDQHHDQGRQADSARRRQRVIKAINAASRPAARSASRRSRAPQVSTGPSPTGTRTCCPDPRRPDRTARRNGGPWSAAPPCRPTWPTPSTPHRQPRTPGSWNAGSQRSSASKPGRNRGSEPRPTSISSSGASQPSNSRSWSCPGNSRNASRSSTARGTNRELMTKLNRHI